MRVPSYTNQQVRLRDVLADDLSAFFEHQLDADANHMAAFTVPDPTDSAAFMARWNRILADDTITKRTILFEGRVAGHVLQFEQFGKPSVSYWIDKSYWGRRVATTALTLFLADVKTRPLYARAAQDNHASIRVLQKCGFVIVDHARGFAPARGIEVEETILALK